MIGFEKRHNQALGIEDEAEFVRFMLSDVPRKTSRGSLSERSGVCGVAASRLTPKRDHCLRG